MALEFVFTSTLFALLNCALCAYVCACGINMASRTAVRVPAVTMCAGVQVRVVGGANPRFLGEQEGSHLKLHGAYALEASDVSLGGGIPRRNPRCEIVKVMRAHILPQNAV